MIIFFYGEDSYRLKQSVRKVKEKFISASLGDTNLAILDGKTATYDGIIRQILAIPFLSKTRLVIIENLISEGKKELQEKMVDSLKKVPSSTVLLFTEVKPDKRTALFKKLSKVDKIQEFLPLDEGKLRTWVKRELEMRNAKWEPEVISKLIEYVGNDLWRMSNEIDKLTTYNKQLTTKNIELLVQSQAQKDIFALIDAMASKNLKRAFKELKSLQKAGENDLYILTMIVYQYRNLLAVKDSIERSPNLNSWSIAKKTGINPYVVSKSLPQVRFFTIEKLKKIYRTLLDFDLKIKTGKMESRTALDLLVTKLCHQ